MIEKGIQDSLRNLQEQSAKQHFQKLIQQNQYVGELYSINYETAKVQIQDFERQKVGGIPSLSFLIATRIVLGDDNIDFRKEDSSVILLRVMDAAALPNNSEAERLRVENAQRVSGTENHWDNKSIMDARTNVYLGYAAVECRIIGTLFLDSKDESNPESPLVLKFGCDISNYYPNRGLKVYKPNDEALKTIVNYIDPSVLADYKERFHNTSRVQLGTIRYASTNRKYQQIDDVSVSIFPSDLLSQKSAVFGMTRTGKSNTVKIIAKSVYELRYPQNLEDKSFRVGQIIFDPNGEYANENTQDIDGAGNVSALKNIWQLKPNQEKDKEVVTYGIVGHPNDPDRKSMLINFYLTRNLQIGKEIIDNSFQERESKFIEGFKQVEFNEPDNSDRSALTRYRRRVLSYMSLLKKAGFEVPPFSSTNPEWSNTGFNYTTNGLFGAELLNGRPNARQGTIFNGMLNYQGDPEDIEKFRRAGQTFQNPRPTLNSLADSLLALNDFMKTSDYRSFERWYVEERPNASGENWADEDLKKIFIMLSQSNGAKQIGKVRPFHTHDTHSDYAEDIYADLKKGKLVIIDQSSGEPEINKSSAERIMWVLFRKNQELFREGKVPPEILVYLEEAHNLLPSGKDDDTTTIWVRTAKEGAKYRIGMIYSTQEVSSIQKNILKNTANWFIGHLNNTDETKELCKFYDFADFESSIRRTQDKGFLRVKTLSNYFVIPVQVKKFDIND
jgi:DNA helicase HerA-like ATPase